MSDAESVLRKVLDKIIDGPYKNKTVQLKALNSGGANYTSALYGVTIAAKDEDDLKLFAKVANISGALRKVMNVRTLFETEQYVYSYLVKTYKEIEDKNNVDPEYRFPFPKFYGGDDVEGEETVVLEDLVSKGYTPYSRFKAVDWEHAASAVDSLARFHALSFAFAKEKPEEFARALEKVKYQRPSNMDDAQIKETWNKMVGGAVQVVKEEHKELASEFLLRELSTDEKLKFRLPLGTPVICHGDYRISNLMFQRQNGVLKTIVLDYQTVHSGSPAIDLLYLEFMGTDEEFRRENHTRLVEHYFAELARALDRLGLDVNDVYPRETFDKEFEEMLPVTLRVASFILPLVLVEAERAPQLGTTERVDEIALSPNQQFAERYSGLMSDCVRWGVL